MQANRSVRSITLLAMLLVAAAHAVHARAADTLLTADQRRLDRIALTLRDEPAVRQARAAAAATWGAHAAAGTADGKATLQPALDEVVWHALRAAAANEPAQPAVVWTLAPSYRDGAQVIPGSRFAGDNPDRIYRYAAADSAHRYEIRGQRGAVPARHEFSFETSSSLSLVSPASVALFSRDIDVAADGSFVVSADSTPANGRRNHLQLPAGTRDILIRDTVPDWSRDYNSVSVLRVDDAGPVPRSRDALVQSAATTLAQAAAGPLQVVNQAWKTPANEIRPFVRPSEWGVPGNVIAVNRFSLRQGEALVITLAPTGANYLGVQLTDPWSRSVEYWQRTSSLSDHQALADADGSFTYVLCDTDPGVHNWLDTGGLRDGLILARWELFAQPLAAGAADTLVRGARVVALRDLDSALPVGTRKVTATERAQQIATRARQFERRVASP